MNKMNWLGLTLVLSVTQIGMAQAGEVNPATVPVAKQTISKNYLTAKEAAELKQNLGTKSLLIDVRTPAEIEYVGVADMVDANVPYMMDDYSTWDDKKAHYLMSPNSGFLSKVSDIVANAGLDKSATVIVMCRSGDRSARAADLLTNAGYTKVYSVVEGFEGDLAKDGDHKGQRAVNGWKHAGLPWSYNLNKNKMYIE